MTDRPVVAPVPWPPLIVASTKPTFVKVRDTALTLLMWLLFAILLETEFEMFFGHYLQRLGLGDFDSEGRWLEFFQALRPFVQVALVLVSLLLVAGLLTLRRVARGRRLPQPAPLAAGDEARRVSLDEAELIAARELRVVVVHIEPNGKHRIEPRQAAPP
jgi:poly-beta-1,6-N-acetyl-D-glucosamine biosynthesis protein PgaD